MTGKLVTIAGGSGFLGRHVVRELCARGYVVRVLCRDTIDAAFLKTCGVPGQVVLQYADITQPKTLEGACNGSFAAVNLVSILYANGRQNFQSVNVEGAETFAQEAARAGAERFVHISALGVDAPGNTAHYAKTKLAGEARVQAAFPAATILRPSLIFGHGDGFFERFARLSSFSPILPLIRGGHTKFQPVYAGDVAKAIASALEQADAPGKIYELAGPHIFTFRQMLEKLLAETGRKRCLVNLPGPIAYLKAALLECLPIAPPLTRDQVRMLKTDNIASGALPGLSELGITPAALETHLPDMLQRYKTR
jgi:uncharacterized protein YbjT (DUF2867 family)